MKKPTKKQIALIEKINEIFGLGYKISVKQDDDSIALWTIKHPATILGGHTPVIWPNEHNSCYAADRVILPKGSRYELKITFEDNAQDFNYFIVSYYADYKFGNVINAGPFQNEIWTRYSVLNGKPVIGGVLQISLSPNDEVITVKHKITEIEVIIKK